MSFEMFFGAIEPMIWRGLKLAFDNPIKRLLENHIFFIANPVAFSPNNRNKSRYVNREKIYILKSNIHRLKNNYYSRDEKKNCARMKTTLFLHPLYH